MSAAERDQRVIAMRNDPYVLGRFFQQLTLPHKGRALCWVWRGACDEKGYGLFQPVPGLMIRPHRFSLLVFGQEPLGDLYACHHCDVPPCCNPAHLYAGTPVANNADRDRRGRHVALQGEAHGNAKLTAENVRELRALWSDNPTDQRASQATIWRALNGHSWSHL